VTSAWGILKLIHWLPMSGAAVGLLKGFRRHCACYSAHAAVSTDKLTHRINGVEPDNPDMNSASSLLFLWAPLCQLACCVRSCQQQLAPHQTACSWAPLHTCWHH
jgi:hypothetical protein